MSAHFFNPGDVVHVVFDGTVQSPPDSLGWLSVKHLGGSRGGHVKATDCRLIVPSIKVGDVVTAENIEQLPPGSIIAAPKGSAWLKAVDGWYAAGIQRVATDTTMSREADRRVLRIGDGE